MAFRACDGASLTRILAMTQNKGHLCVSRESLVPPYSDTASGGMHTHSLHLSYSVYTYHDIVGVGEGERRALAT